MDEIVLDVNLRSADEHDVARDAPVVPPVKGHGGNRISTAAVVDLDADEVVPVNDVVGDINLERGEPSLMACQFVPVEPNGAAVADRAEIEKEPFSGACRRCAEMPRIPNRSLIILKLRNLAVEVPRDIEPEAAVKRIFKKLCLCLRLAVKPQLFAPPKVVEVDYCVSLTVKKLIVTPIDILHKFGRAVSLPVFRCLHGVITGMSRHRQDRDGKRRE